MVGRCAGERSGVFTKVHGCHRFTGGAICKVIVDDFGKSDTDLKLEAMFVFKRDRLVLQNENCGDTERFLISAVFIMRINRILCVFKVLTEKAGTGPEFGMLSGS